MRSKNNILDSSRARDKIILTLLVTIFLVSAFAARARAREEDSSNEPSFARDVNLDLENPQVTYDSRLDAGEIEYWALVIGISDYIGTENDLDYCDDDAMDICSALVNYQGWDPSHIFLLIDSEATWDNVIANLSMLSTIVDSNDVFLLTFSGHGSYYQDDNGDELDGYDELLILHDLIGFWDDELEIVLGWFDTDKIMVFLDSCFSGGFIRVTSDFREEELVSRSLPGIQSVRLEDSFSRDLDKSGFVVLTSSDDDELSYEHSALENGVFTYFFVEGIESGFPADLNTNGYISAEEAFNYASPLTTAFIPFQNPQLYDGVPGELEFTIIFGITDVEDISGNPISSGIKGDTVVVKGSGATPSVAVNLYWDFVTASDLLNTTSSDMDGFFEVRFNVPEAYNGDHYLWVKDTDTGICAISPGAFTVFAREFACIIDTESPSEVYTGSSFTVNFTVSYDFTIPTRMCSGIYDMETGSWITDERETLVGEGNKTYSFDLTAPEEETTWALGSVVWYNLDGEWIHNEEGYLDAFEISVVHERVFSIDYVTPGNVTYGDVLTVMGSGATAGNTVNIYWDYVTAANLLNTTIGLPSGDFECEVDVPSAYYGNHYLWAKDLATGISTRSDAIFVVSDIFAHEIPLFVGWNLVGLPCMPEDPRIEVVLSEIIDYVDCVWAFDGETKTWFSYAPGAPSDLTEMVDDKGYWINVNTDTILRIYSDSE